MTAPPLSAIMRHAKPAFHQSLRGIAPTVQSRLDNGFRIASQAKAGEVCTVGVWVNAGSRYETAATNGVSQFVEHLNFKGTGKRSRRDIEYAMEKIGAQLNAVTSREQTCYYVKCLKKDAADAVELISDVVLNSVRSEKDVDAVRAAILAEKEDVESRIDEVTMDHLHSGAFEGSGAGLSLFGTTANIEKNITKKTVDEYVAANYIAPRMVLVGAGGIEHAQLADLGAKYFGAAAGGASKAPKPTRYMGGEKREFNELIPTCHFAVAFGTPGLTSPDALKIKVLEQLIGSYSRDKGEAAYSCLTRAIVADFYDPHIGVMRTMELAEHNPIHSINGFWNAYSDAGLLGFYLVVEPGKPYSHNVETATTFGMREIVRITQAITDEEFERAKNQTKVAALLALDGTTSIADSIGRQVLTLGAATPLESLFQQIDNISKADLVAVAHDLIYDKDPICAAVGDLTQVPQYDVMRRMTYWAQV